MNFVRIDSSYAHIESQGELNMDGVGYGPEKGPGAGFTINDSPRTGVGAGHGGYGGGPGPAYGGVPYNSIYEPVMAGSGGGNSSGEGGSGGGYLEWYNGDLIEINGLLTLSGADGKGGNAGGGSGGGVLLHSMNISGHGVIAVPGGNGVGIGGGGSGGRVSMNCKFRYSYGGQYLNYGGDSTGSVSSSHAGASGTTFIEENKRALQYRMTKYDTVKNTTYFDVDHHVIHSDNKLKYSPAPTVIQDPPRELYEFDEMEITGSTYTWIYHPNGVDLVEVIAHLFIGDKTGQLHIRPKQKVWVEYIESESNITEAPVSYIIDYGAEVVFPEEVHIHGTNSTIAGQVTGVHNMYIESDAWVEFKSTGNTALLVNGEYFRKTATGHFIWNELHMKRGGTAGFLDILDFLVVETSEIKVKYQGNLYMNKAFINSTYSWIESEGVFHLNGHGYKQEEGPGAGFTRNSVGCGAGHGGYGGCSDPINTPEPYGSIFDPYLLGSGGGNGGGVGGSGGGSLLWVTSHYFELHGLLALQGTDGKGGNAGGGSGGSLLIKSLNFTGHGVIDIAGGNASGNGGGGSGGRAAIHCEWRYSFGGTFINQPGQGGTADKRESHAGAAGTSFVKNNLRPLEYRIVKYMKGSSIKYFEVDHRYIHIDCKMIASPVATMIMENNTRLFEFNETEVNGKARILFYHPPELTATDMVTVIIHRFYGDRTGQVHVRSNQLIYVEYIESESNRTEAPVSYIIDAGAEVVFPTEVHMQGINTTLAGQITGVHHLYIQDGCELVTESTSQTAQLVDEKKVELTEPGNFRLPTINIMLEGILQFRKIETDFTISAAFLQLKYGGIIYMNHGFVEAGEIDIETTGEFSLEGRGHPAMQGPGAGAGLNGGSYGGVGYGGNDDLAYGSLFTPKDLGSGGGGSTGGAGGGFVNFTVGRRFHIDGIIDAYGLAASGNGGGGSGGSVLIKAYNMSGNGVIDVSGGKGSGSGGGGSGGRLAAHIDSTNEYGGAYKGMGGVHGNGDLNHAGGPGTIYKYESSRGPTYRELKYNPRLNKTEIKPEHTKLTIDNGYWKTTNPGIVMEKDSDYYEFDEVQVEGYSYVHFYHPDTADVIQVKIHELTGDRKGMVRVQSRQQVMVKFVAATHTYMDSPCGFHVDPYGELILPSTYVMLTEQTIISGLLIGVEELIIERDAEFVINLNASTSDVTRITMGTMQPTNPGIFNIQQISTNNLGLFTIDMNPRHLVLSSANFTIRNGGKVDINTQKVTLDVAYLDVEKGGLLDGSESGYARQTGPGAGSSTSLDGSGGGLASKGEYFVIRMLKLQNIKLCKLVLCCTHHYTHNKHVLRSQT
ncbi:hypothetical protein DPMN_003926 [Dreissena polymorpha]|uniref:Uncharacterized protein n=1 Tax=Dreissena polymorpha TaxID=45954 RepID=A0A9D4MQM3_DREPO|nr:hypothetical protein DPMN_003926 [Dreissena polymorpha]